MFTPGKVVRGNQSYAKEIFMGVPAHDLQHRKNVNKQVDAPILLTF